MATEMGVSEDERVALNKVIEQFRRIVDLAIGDEHRTGKPVARHFCHRIFQRRKQPSADWRLRAGVD